MESNGHQNYLATHILPKYQYLCSTENKVIRVSTFYNKTEHFKPMIKILTILLMVRYTDLSRIFTLQNNNDSCAKIKTHTSYCSPAVAELKLTLSVKQSGVERAALICVRMAVGQS